MYVSLAISTDVDCVWNVMAHAQKPDFVFRRNGRVHLNRRGLQFSRLLAAELCASAVVMLDTPFSEVVRRVLTTHSIRQFPFSSPPVRHRVPSRFNWTLPTPRNSTVYQVKVSNHVYLEKFSYVKHCIIWSMSTNFHGWELLPKVESLCRSPKCHNLCQTIHNDTRRDFLRHNANFGSISSHKIQTEFWVFNTKWLQ